MPVRCFEWAGGDAVWEWGVALDSTTASGVAWMARPADTALTQIVLARKKAADDRGLPWGKGYRGEHAAWVAPWLASLAASIESGAVLIIDYGYSRHDLDHPGRTDGTLCAHYRHRRLDDRDAWLSNPGRQDLTAHVDFSLVASSAEKAGLQVLGFVSQARFLINAGL
jgi:SAM-dependent MidA family methyltransferase